MRTGMATMPRRMFEYIRFGSPTTSIIGSAEDFLPQDGQLHFRQPVADAAMDAETKRQMLARTRRGR